jgi:signal transduction histidine kinase
VSPPGPAVPAGDPAPDADGTGDAVAGWAALDALADGVIAVVADRTVVAANAAALRLLGRSRDALVGADCSRAVDARSDDGSRPWGEGWPTAARLRSVRAVPEQLVTVRRGDGREVTVAVTAAYRRNADGRLVGAVISLRDGGHRARAASVSGIEIVSTVSHELRSPLTSVKGYTSLLLNRWDRLTDEQKQMMLGQVHHDADRVTRLISELLDISRLETGKLVLRRQLVDLPSLTGTVVDKVRLEYPDIDASVRFADGFPALYADPDKVEQVLTNLLENACKYASPLGLTVTGDVGEAEVSVTVADCGDGIPAEDLPKVFTKFFRRHEGRPNGSGLGLWISRGLVESHGGRLVATSTPGHGSAFRFTLPVVDLEDLIAP